jgi:hypothetical protein
MAKQTAQQWIGKACDPKRVWFHFISETKEAAQFFSGGRTKRSVWTTKKSPLGQGVTFPLYCLTKSLEADPEDIVVCASDDMYAPGNWDVGLDFLFSHEDEKPCSVYFRMDYGKDPSIRYIALPVLNMKALEKCNRIVYNPEYAHNASDCEFLDVCKELQLVLEVPPKNPLFRYLHKHPLYNTRQADQYDGYQYQQLGPARKQYLERKKMSLEERLELSPAIVKVADFNIEKWG